MESWTKEQLNNWISHQQCCLGTYLKKVVKLGEIGSKDFKCCMNKFILANIYLEMLTCMDSDEVLPNIHGIINTNSNQTAQELSFSMDVDGVIDVIAPTTLISGIGGIQIAQSVADVINNSDSGFTSEVVIENGIIDVVIYAPDQTYNGQSVVINIQFINPPKTTKVYNFVLSGGVESDKACLTKDEQCELIGFIKDLCKTC